MKIHKLNEKDYIKKIVKEEFLSDNDDYGEEYASDEYANAVKDILMSFYIPDSQLEEREAAGFPCEHYLKASRREKENV